MERLCKLFVRFANVSGGPALADLKWVCTLRACSLILFKVLAY